MLDQVTPHDSFPAPPGVATSAWQLHREMVLVLGWGRAILLQIAHPLVAAGVFEHTGFRRERLGWVVRFRRTLVAMLESTFGTEEEVAAVARRINAIHDRVHGRLRAPAGTFAAATPYSAHDPELLRWVHATLIESHLLAYELYVAPLDRATKDRYCAEACGMEVMLGMPAGFLPRSVSELSDYLAGRLASGAITVTDEARHLARDIVSPPGSRILFPLFWLIRLPTIGLLPPRIRHEYGLAWSPGRERVLHASARAVRSVLPFTPSALRHWPRARAAFRAARAAGETPGKGRRPGSPALDDLG